MCSLRGSVRLMKGAPWYLYISVQLLNKFWHAGRYLSHSDWMAYLCWVLCSLAGTAWAKMFLRSLMEVQMSHLLLRKADFGPWNFSASFIPPVWTKNPDSSADRNMICFTTHWQRKKLSVSISEVAVSHCTDSSFFFVLLFSFFGTNSRSF